MSTNRTIYINLSIILTSFVVFFGASYVMLELSAAKYADRSEPKQFLHDINISGKSQDEVKELLPIAFANYLEEYTTFDFENGQTVVIQNKELAPVLDTEGTLNNISYYVGQPTFWQFFKDIVIKNDKNLVINFDPALVISTIDENSESIKLTADAYFDITKNGEVFIHPEVNGQGIDQTKLISKLKSRTKTIKFKAMDQAPQVTTSDLEPYKNTYQKIVSSPIILNADSLQFLLDFKKNPNMLVLQFEQEVPSFIINSVELSRFVLENLADAIEQAPENTQISLVADKGKFLGSSKPGVKIDTEKLEEELNKYLKVQNTNFISIPVVSVEPILEISEELQSRGIKELHTTIYTTFNGSTANRIHNITIGASKYNGLIIKKGETFSFNDNLGEVDAVNGFLPELVIKAEGTIPEFGGGLCQVSSTIYRAALFAGLKIAERYPHSYAVGYYAQVLGHGLDATIYPGNKDFKFINDTPGDILIESFVEGTKMTVNFYGTKDSRTVEVNGPEIGEKTSTNESIYVVKNDLPAGTIKQVEKSTPGFKAAWTRTITYPNGETSTENIISNYRTVANKYLVSPDKDPNVNKLLNSPLPPIDETGIPRI